MRKRTIFLVGIVMILGITTTVLFDIPPFISSAVTFLGLGIIMVTASRMLSTGSVEKE